MSASDKTKLNGIASGANAYSHPTTSGNKHIPSGGSSGQILRWSADGTATWGADNNTTYSAATQSANGLMSAADKKKLDGIATGANAYLLPVATNSVLGGVKIGSNITNSFGTISITAANVKAALSTGSGTTKYLREDGTWQVPPDNNTTYSVVTSTTNGLMTPAMLSKLGAGGIIAASLATNGYVKFANNLIIQWSINATYDSTKKVHVTNYPLVFPNKVYCSMCSTFTSARQESTFFLAKSVGYDTNGKEPNELTTRYHVLYDVMNQELIEYNVTLTNIRCYTLGY